MQTSMHIICIEEKIIVLVWEVGKYPESYNDMHNFPQSGMDWSLLMEVKSHRQTPQSLKPQNLHNRANMFTGKIVVKPIFFSFLLMLPSQLNSEGSHIIKP